MLEVAKLIADPPPRWLVLMLEQFAVRPNKVKIDKKFFHSTVDNIDRACTVLLRWLPAWEHMPFDMQCSKEIKAVLAALPSIQTDLARLRRRSPGRPTKFAQTTCA